MSKSRSKQSARQSALQFQVVKRRAEEDSREKRRKLTESTYTTKRYNEATPLQTTPTSPLKSSSVEDVLNKLKDYPRKDQLQAALTKSSFETDVLSATPTKSKVANVLRATPTKSPKLSSLTTSKADLLQTTPTKSPLAKSSTLMQSSKEDLLQTTPTKSPSLSKFSSVELHSPSPRKKAMRALCYDTSSSSLHLQLPYKYRLLEDKFRCTNVALSMLEKRKETCTFSKLRKAVQEMTRKNFETKDVARMKYLFPESLVLRQEKNLPGSLSKEEYNSYQLTISSTVIEWNPSILLERQKVFHSKLLAETIKHHQVFLSSLTPPVSIPDDKLNNWHIRFELESVPDPPEAKLPRPPVNETYNSASDILKQTEVKISSRVKTALEKITKESNEVPIPEATPTFLKGVSSELIERIRKKGAMKAAVAMTRSDENTEKLLMLSRLSEMTRIIRQLFVTEGKAAILWSHLLQKVSDSHSSSLSTEQVEEHVVLLMDTIPDWCFTVTVRKNKYLKLKNKTLSHQKINEYIKRKEELVSK